MKVSGYVLLALFTSIVAGAAWFYFARTGAEKRAAAILANFGASDQAIFAVIFGKFNPTGKLPIELPRSAEAVACQKEDVPHDAEAPLFSYGFGLGYKL